MERLARLASHAHSYSALSLVEGSEVISEAEEIHEVKNLHRSGSELFKEAKFAKALKCYNEALEIDENSMESLQGRAAAYLEMGRPAQAMLDVQKLVTLDEENPEVQFLLGRTRFQQGDNKGALLAFLRVFLLNPDTEHVDLLTTNIAFLASKFASIPELLRENLSKLEPYNKLCEVGACLYQARQFQLCVQVLTAAQQLQTNQQGITMKLLLTLANAHSQNRQQELAVSIYQELLSTAQSAHDVQYQTKALVNIASLFLEIGDTHNAIVYYERLLDLQKDLQGEDPEGRLPFFWNQDLQCALHLNLSIAYKAIGDIHKAKTHAQLYITVVEGCKTKENAEARSHLNIGTLHEILGEYEKALDHYKAYLSLCKEKGDKKGTAQAYGSLGSVYAHLRNGSLSETYHDQHVALAKKLDDPKLLTVALEQAGDSHTTLEHRDKAVESYLLMLQSCQHINQSQTKAMALCKLGNAHRAQERYQHSTYYYQQAKTLAEDSGYTTIIVLCEYHLACIMQHSSQAKDLEQARKNFQKLIPLLEGKIQQHRDEDTFCPSELLAQLQACYQGLQNVLAKMGKKAECLEYTEAFKKKHLPQESHKFEAQMFDMWTVDKMTRVVSQQTATVLYYAVLPSRLLLWVLQPGEGLTRFYPLKSADETKTITEQVQDLLSELKQNRDLKELQYSCENRALPLKETQLEIMRKKNMALSQASKRQKIVESLQQEAETENSMQKGKKQPQNQKPVERRLFDLLIAPVEDVLSQLKEESSLIVIPDGILFDCPFSILQDWHGHSLSNRFHLTLLPSLHALAHVTQSELDQLKTLDELDFERGQAKMGGTPKVLSQAEYAQMTGKHDAYGCPTPQQDVEDVNLRQISNPRLVTSGAVGSRGQRSPTRPIGSQQHSFVSGVTVSTARSCKRPGALSTIPSVTTCTSPRTPQKPDTPTRLERSLGSHTLCTLTSRTSTDTDITTSDLVVTEFQQISDAQKCVVIGCPKLPSVLKLHDSDWRPSGGLKVAQNECHQVADYLDVMPLLSEQATKDTFLQRIKEASVLHVATTACLKTGVLVMTPNPTQKKEDEPIAEQQYLVTAAEIAQTPLVAKLVVLSSGWSWYDRGYVDEGFSLPGAFLAAGAQCVLTLLWPVTNEALLKFYYHFYAALQSGCLVTSAVAEAAKGLRENDRFADISSWCPFILIGKDVHIDLTQIRHSMMDQKMDRAEKEVTKDLGVDPLNQDTITPNLASREENLCKLQECLSRILAEHCKQPNVIDELLQLLDSSLKRLYQTQAGQPSFLNERLQGSEAATALLTLLGFHFQAQGAYVTDPYVVYPHWNPDDLMMPAFDALRALSDMTGHAACLRTLQELLPTSQTFISHTVDVLCITKHSPEIQLKVCDASVRPLWRNSRVKAALSQLGFQQIGLLLNFHSIPSTRKLLTSALQLFIAVSSYKSPTLLHKLDVTLLGGPHGSKASGMSVDNIRLPSLTPLLLPRNQLRISTPWLSTVERPEEMAEKLKLAKSKSDLASEYKKHFVKARTWHQATVAGQGNESLSKLGRPRSTPQKVKVKGGGHASGPRIPVEQEPELDLDQSDRRRDHARYVLQQRIDDVTLRHRNDVNKLYLPYIQNV